MEEHIVGPMPVGVVMKEFLPERRGVPTVHGNYFSSVHLGSTKKNKAGVRYVPVVDLRQPEETCTQELIGGKWVCSFSAQLDSRRHHRLLEEYIPDFIQDSESTKSGVRAIYHALIAHKMAYEHGILHQDISHHSVMIRDNGEGVLIDPDWELPIRTQPCGRPVHFTRQQLYRTGTWAFISRRLLSIGHIKEPHEVGDDLESFYYLLLYVTLDDFRPKFKTGDMAGYALKVIFDDIHCSEGYGSYVGGAGKLEMLQPNSFMEGFELKSNAALSALLGNIRHALIEEIIAQMSKQSLTRTPTFQSHTFLINEFKKALDSDAWTQGRPVLGAKAEKKRRLKRKAT